MMTVKLCESIWFQVRLRQSVRDEAELGLESESVLSIICGIKTVRHSKCDLR